MGEKYIMHNDVDKMVKELSGMYGVNAQEYVTPKSFRLDLFWPVIVSRMPADDLSIWLNRLLSESDAIPANVREGMVGILRMEMKHRGLTWVPVISE